MVESEQELLRGLSESASPRDLALALDRLIEKRVKEREQVLSPDHKARVLALYESLITVHEFQPGQLVKWKGGMKNKRRPDEGAPAIVIDVLAEPVLDTESGPSSVYFREPLDLIVGVLDSDDEFLIIHVDRRRFEPFEGEAAPA
jgi:hypothetical protein